jgi:curved DNA-binding protein CbpA
MDPYATLNVARDATPAEIAKAYKRAALACHPDRHPDDPRAAETFDKVSKAYQLLSNSTECSMFDQGITTEDGGDIFANLARMFGNGVPEGSSSVADGARDARGAGSARGVFKSTTTVTKTELDGTTSTTVTTTGAGGSATTTETKTDASHPTVGFKSRKHREKGQEQLNAVRKAQELKVNQEAARAEELKVDQKVQQVPNQIVFRPYGLKDFFPGKGVLCKRVGEHSFKYLTDGEIEELLKVDSLDLSSFWYQTDNQRFTNPLDIRRV